MILIERNNPIELDYSNRLKDKIIKYLVKYLYRFANVIISISKELGNDLEKLCKKKVITIYNPSFNKDIYKFNYHKNIKKTYKTILNVGRFEKQKNQIMLLKSFKNIQKDINVKLLLVGYGSEKKNLINFVIKNNLRKKVIFAKEINNVSKYYKRADLFVLTSIYEGFGNVLVEAGMFKIPIISTDCKSGPREILKNGKFGDLVKINDVKNLNKLIIKNLKKPNYKKVSLMFESLERFGIKSHISKYEKIFRKI